ncbi:hypothetical protein PG994_005065 [Apiospora phragmitis]|uniref:Uncharacterized protein n=1 Tax=Apiospora phragmitis TaxID=2905665 RepID=A0ABR1VV20_9PEZI
MEDERNNADFYRPLNTEDVELRLLLVQAGEGDEPTLLSSEIEAPLLKHHLITFFSSPWFERVWEALLAPKSLVHIGTYEIDFDKLLLSATWLTHASSTLDLSPLDQYVGLLNCQTMYDLGHKTDDNKALDTILDKLSTFYATDPRDYVYGVLGLYQSISGLEGPLMPALLTSDYTKSVAAVMRDTNRYIIEQSPNLDFLRRLRHQPETAYERTGVPSWAEPWHLRSNSSNSNKCALASDMRHTLYSADNAVGKRETAVTAATLNDDPEVLVLTGVIAGKVKDVTSCVIDGSPEQFADLLESADSPIHLDRLRADAETIGFAVIAEATAAPERPTAEYARTSILAWADFIVKHKARPSRDIVDNNNNTSRRGTKENLYTTFEKAAFAEEEEWSALVDYDDAVTSATQGRRIFRTEAGNIGLGPRDMVADGGDVVAVLYGCRWPVILRPRGGGHGGGWFSTSKEIYHI